MLDTAVCLEAREWELWFPFSSSAGGEKDETQTCKNLRSSGPKKKQGEEVGGFQIVLPDSAGVCAVSDLSRKVL